MVSCGSEDKKVVPEEINVIKAGNIIKEEVVKDYNYYMKRISNDEKWMKYIKEQAEELNISVDSLLSMESREWASKQQQ